VSEFEQIVSCKVEFCDRPGHRVFKIVEVWVHGGWLYVRWAMRLWRARVAWPDRTRRHVTADKILDCKLKLEEVSAK
jgi:hypothetical protein